MPFDDDYGKPPAKPTNAGLKQVSSQKSIFDDVPKKPTQDDLNKKVKHIQEKSSEYKIKASELSQQFKKLIGDKTLAQNKSIFVRDAEKELLVSMIRFASEVNNDDNTSEGEGSMALIALLLNTYVSQRDRINQLEYELKKTINSSAIDTKKTNG